MEELVVIVAEGCRHCKELVRKLESEKVKFRVVDVTKDLNAAKVVRDLGIFKVPLVLAVRKTENGVEACVLDDQGKIKCVEEAEI